jgi:hypothetical protein
VQTFSHAGHELDEVKNHPDVLKLYLSRARFKKNGSEYETCCPFHLDKTPSCKINQKEGRWLWFCHGCQRGGSIVDFVMACDYLEEGAAIQTIKKELGHTGTYEPRSKNHTRDEKKNVKVSWTDYAKAEQNLAASPKAQAWLEEHGISPETAKLFHLGYCGTNKYSSSTLPSTVRDGGWITIPYIEHGQIALIKFRSIVEKAFSRKPDMKTCLLNTDSLTPGLKTDVYLVSGDFDAMVLVQAGFRSISLPGDGFTVTQELADELTKSGRIILAGDNDAPGLARMLKIQAVMNAPLLQWPADCKDARDLSLKHKGDVKGFRELVERLTKEAIKEPAVESEEEDEAPETIPLCPIDVVTGGYIGELTKLLTDGTTIPPEFVFQNTMMLLGAMVDGKIGYNSHETIHTRFYSVNVSNLPRSGKGESWVRTGEEATGLLSTMLAERNIKIMDASLYGSGEFMVGSLSEYAKAVQKGDITVPVHVVARCDEMAEIFEKSKALGSTLQTKLLQMFERNTVSTGSFKNKEHAVHNLHFSVSGDFTFDGFQKSFAGQGASGSGLLSRFTYSYAKRSPYQGRWPGRDNIALVRVLAMIRRCLEKLDEYMAAEEQDLPFGSDLQKFIPPETAGATVLHEAFLKELESEEGLFTSELPSHFRRYLLLQTVFSDQQVIDETRTQQAILWTRHQLAVRKALWPEDGGKEEEQFERKILKALAGRSLSLRRLMDWCNVDRAGSGGHEVFLRALTALMKARRTLETGKNRRGHVMYGLMN